VYVFVMLWQMTMSRSHCVAWRGAVPVAWRDQMPPSLEPYAVFGDAPEPPPMAAPVTGAKAALSVATVLSGCCALCMQPISRPHSDTASFVMQDGVSHSGADVLHVVCGNLVRRSVAS
jgi:hypothetical protein